MSKMKPEQGEGGPEDCGGVAILNGVSGGTH